MTAEFLKSLLALANEVTELAAKNGTDPLNELAILRASLRVAVTKSTQAELDAKFGR